MKTVLGGDLAAAPLDPAQLPGPIWIVAPHPDDEALGCGGLIAALSALGREVWAVLITDGGFSHPASPSFPRPRLVAERLAEWRAGLQILGVPPERTLALAFPDGALEAGNPAALGAALHGALATAPLGTLVLPWSRDPHPDHRVTAQVCWSLINGALPNSLGLPQSLQVLEYPVWLAERGSGAEWPDAAEVQVLALDLQAWRFQKAQAIAAHRTQLGLITDDPGGFALPPAMVERAVQGPEYFFGRAALPGLQQD